MSDSSPELGPIHHLAYIVEEIEPAAQKLHEQFGAGPFFHLEEVPVANPTSRGEPAEFLHASAFGICNGLPVELMQIKSVAPSRATDRFAGATFPRLHHSAYALPAATVESVRASLDEGGLPEYLRASFGEDVEFSYHDGVSSFGHDLEIHVDSEGLRDFFGMMAAAAESWDGSQLLRSPF